MPTSNFSSAYPRRLAGRRLAHLLALVCLVAGLGGCRAAGPGSPVHTVAGFFNKYENKPGFYTKVWSADLLQRLALVRVGKLLGGNDLTNAITGIRTARALVFAPTSGAARDLSREGLTQEVAGLLQAERYTPLAVSAAGPAAYRYVIKASGDKVSELVATGALPDAVGSFVLVQVQGNFTRAQAEALSKVLPEVVHRLSGSQLPGQGTVSVEEYILGSTSWVTSASYTVEPSARTMVAASRIL